MCSQRTFRSATGGIHISPLLPYCTTVGTRVKFSGANGPQGNKSLALAHISGKWSTQAGIRGRSDIDVALPQSITGTGVWLGSSPPITVLRVRLYIIINVRGCQRAHFIMNHDSTACRVWFCSECRSRLPFLERVNPLLSPHFVRA